MRIFDVVVKFGGKSQTFCMEENTKFGEFLELALAEASSSLPGLKDEYEIKLLYKGKKIEVDQEKDRTLALVFGAEKEGKAVTILLMATRLEEMVVLERKKEAHDQAIRNYNRALVSRPRHEIVQQGYARKIQVLGEFSDHEAARMLLQRVRDDPAIKMIMKKREWYILELIELHPHRDSSILGYNRNQGATIALRLRTDALDGFRSYPSIIKVMLHELAHMVWGDHDANFHALDRELNAEYARNQGVKLNGTSGGALAPAASYQSSSRALGGKAVDLQAIPMREVLAQAALLRLTKEEEEMQKACGKRE
ncbi:hypothetical protein HDV03_001243 [Kappamyces sp. JEL0829]|nr:hypothetical protein HDV03_001243 [Kappamyces sp. JEL0829]